MEEMTTEAIEPVYVDEERPDVRAGGPWKIETVTSLDWAMSRLCALQLELADLAEQERARVAAIEERAHLLAQKAERGVAFFESMISEYAHRNRDTLLGGGRKKSREVLSGTVGWRTKPGRLVVLDKEALGAWLERQAPDAGLYRIRLDPDLAALKAHYEATGTIPPGTEWQDETETFFVKTQPLDILKGE